MKKNSKRILVITGPTGSGKTSLAEKLFADRMNSLSQEARLFNTDPFQFYREIPILSNQPKKLEPWEFVQIKSISEPISAGEFSRLAGPNLEKEGIWVGAGLYLYSVLFGLDEDKRKGTPFQSDPKFPLRILVLNPAREDLYGELNRRVDQMIEAGAAEEAEKIFELIQNQKIEVSNPVTKAIGLKHLLSFLAKETTYAEAVELWKRDTRRLAKRQWTWLRKFAPSKKDDLAQIFWTGDRKKAEDWLIDSN